MCRAYILLRIIINYCFIFFTGLFFKISMSAEKYIQLLNTSWQSTGMKRLYKRRKEYSVCDIVIYFLIFFVMYGYELYSAFENSHMNSKVIKWNNLRHQKITNLLREMSATIYIKEILPQHELKLNVSCYFHTRRIR